MSSPLQERLPGGDLLGAEKSLRDSRRILDHYDFKEVSKNFFVLSEATPPLFGKLTNSVSSFQLGRKT